MVQDTTLPAKIHKTYELEPNERKALQKVVAKKPSQEVAAQDFNIKLSTFRRILDLGRGSYENICKVRAKI